MKPEHLIDYSRFWCPKCKMRVHERDARLGYHEYIVYTQGIVIEHKHPVVPMPSSKRNHV